MFRRRRERRAAQTNPTAVLDMASVPVHLLAVNDPVRLQLWNEHGRFRWPERTQDE